MSSSASTLSSYLRLLQFFFFFVHLIFFSFSAWPYHHANPTLIQSSATTNLPRRSVNLRIWSKKLLMFLTYVIKDVIRETLNRKKTQMTRGGEDLTQIAWWWSCGRATVAVWSWGTTMAVASCDSVCVEADRVEADGVVVELLSRSTPVRENGSEDDLWRRAMKKDTTKYCFVSRISNPHKPESHTGLVIWVLLRYKIIWPQDNTMSSSYI